jgi:glycine cleavage system H protein
MYYLDFPLVLGALIPNGAGYVNLTSIGSSGYKIEFLDKPVDFCEKLKSLGFQRITGWKMDIEGYEFPEGLYFEKNHFWARVEGDLVVMGMNDYAQKMAGDIVYVGFPPEGKKPTQGKNFTKLESGKWLGKVFAVVSGELVEVNEELEEDARLINEDPYGKGWMFKIRPDNADELKNLMTDAGEIHEWLKGEIAEHGRK